MRKTIKFLNKTSRNTNFSIKLYEYKIIVYLK